MSEISSYYVSFDCDLSSSIVGIKWNEWLDGLQNYLGFVNITEDRRKIAALLHHAGLEVVKMYRTVEQNAPDADNETRIDTFEDVKRKISSYFNPRKNLWFERHNFRQAKQEVGESIAAFATRLRTLAKYCEFVSVEEEIIGQIIEGSNCTEVISKALRSDNTLKLDELLNWGRTREIAYQQVKHIKEGVHGTVNFVSKAKLSMKSDDKYKSKKIMGNEGLVKTGKKCWKCGFDYPHENECPAKGKKCDKCGGDGHFAKVCRKEQDMRLSKDKRSVNHVQEEKSEDEYVFSVRSGSELPKVVVKVQGVEMVFVIDTGATINIIEERMYQKIKEKVTLRECFKRVFAYKSKEPIRMLGEFTTTFESKGVSITADVAVVMDEGECLLSYKTAQNLGIIQIINTIDSDDFSRFKDKFTSLFSTGIGKLKGYMLKLHVDESIKPSKQFHCRIPFHLRKAVEAELESLLKLGIIERVVGPTTWISPIHVVPRKEPGRIRIVVNAKGVNKAIKRERHICPTIDDLVLLLNGASWFSKVDFNNGYRQIELDPESRHLTTFSTHIGLFWDTRLNFGFCSAAEMFQFIIGNVLVGLEGVTNVSDDIIIFAQTREEHEVRLLAVLERLNASGLTVNLSKCEFCKRKIEFFGVVFSAEGMSPSAGRVEALNSVSSPKNVNEVRSLLGMATYSSRFIHDFSTLTEPLRELVRSKKHVKFVWTEKHEKTLDVIRASLKTDAVAYFNPNLETELIVDASPVGLGAVLVQYDPKIGKEKQIVAYASRTLSECERKYAHVEKEALACVYGCERFHIYLFGQPFTLVTDNKAIHFIYNSSSGRAQARIERWGLRLSPYDFKIVHRPGKDNIADLLSRHPNPNEEADDDWLCEKYVNFVVDSSIPKAMSREIIAKETMNDSTLQLVSKAIKKENMTAQELRIIERFGKLLNEMALSSDSIIMRNHQVVLPKSLQRRAIEIAHEGHLGVVKTKQLLRSKVWFPEIEKLAELIVGQCRVCQVCVPVKQATSPVHMSEMPRKVWDEVSADFYGPLPSLDYLFCIIDDASRYPVVEIVRSTCSDKVLLSIDRTFSMFGIPSVMRTDNGPPFNGKAFAEYAKLMGFRHRKITPLWPRANGKCERFMRNLGKVVTGAQVSGKPWKQELNKFLRTYRSTPHSSTKVAPAMLLLNRTNLTRLPELQEQELDWKSSLELARQNDKVACEKLRTYNDAKRKPKPQCLNIGDVVVVKQQKRFKTTPYYESYPYRVINVKGTMITAKNKIREITRDVSFFKKILIGPSIVGDSTVVQLGPDGDGGGDENICDNPDGWSDTVSSDQNGSDLKNNEGTDKEFNIENVTPGNDDENVGASNLEKMAGESAEVPGREQRSSRKVVEYRVRRPYNKRAKGVARALKK